MGINFDKEISIVIAGEAGQGIDTITSFIAKSLKKAVITFFTRLNICPESKADAILRQ